MTCTHGTPSRLCFCPTARATHQPCLGTQITSPGMSFEMASAMSSARRARRAAAEVPSSWEISSRRAAYSMKSPKWHSASARLAAISRRRSRSARLALTTVLSMVNCANDWFSTSRARSRPSDAVRLTAML